MTTSLERTGSNAKSTDSPAVLTANGITKAFAGQVVLRDLSFAIRGGEVMGLLGPNGAGKTTAIRVLSTIYRPTRGSFTLDGISNKQESAIRQRIGVLPESSGYPRAQTGSEFLRYHAMLFGHSATRAQGVADTLLGEVGLAERGSTRIGTYSRGMRQRLGVARALINQPEVVFLDEPTLGLDPVGQRQMLALISDVAAQRGAAVILSSHLLDEIEEVCTHALVLNRGATVAQGTVEEIKGRVGPRIARVQVPADQLVEALAALGGIAGIRQAEVVDRERGRLAATLDDAWIEEIGAAAMNSILTGMIDAGVTLLAAEMTGGSLSDAFLQLVQEGEG